MFHNEEFDVSSLHSIVNNRQMNDKGPTAKPEDDKQRRTIIVEKKYGSYGFSLQSYGIHYKTVREVEMITYVDNVKYDGPAFHAGMREGDVILSINGTDMEHSDHKTIVNFIKACDSYMRIVVLFEDCVRKVFLHVRYIKLQKTMQDKLAELDKVCLQEVELLQGKWKTHSLPARKKKNYLSYDHADISTTIENAKQKFFRPSISTEYVDTYKAKYFNPPPAQLMFAYHYFNPHYRYVLQPEKYGSGEYIVSIENSTCITNIQQKIQCEIKLENSSTLPSNIFQNKGKKTQVNLPNKNQTNQSHIHKCSRHGHEKLCYYCVQNLNEDAKEMTGKDNVSLEAYDLATPCCETHCVPMKKRSRHRKEHHHKHRHQSSKNDSQRPKSYSNTSPTPNQRCLNCENKKHTPRSVDDSPGITRKCRLHPCSSREAALELNISNGSSYVTSLHSNTVCLEQLNENTKSSHQIIPKKIVYPSSQHPQLMHCYYPNLQIQATPPHDEVENYNKKPKSWDNLTTKAFGGYGFGYGFVDSESQQSTTSVKTENTIVLPQCICRKNALTGYSTMHKESCTTSQFTQCMPQKLAAMKAESNENVAGKRSDAKQESDNVLHPA